jgi:hypothetical protein
VSPLLRRLLSVLVVLAAVGGIVYACSEVDTDDAGDATVTGDAIPIEVYVPADGNEILRQERFGVDLRPGFTGVLQLNGVEIPLDQLDDDTLASTGEVYFTPGEGLAVERYDAGQNCATAVVWPVEDSRSDARDYSWCFNVT